MADKKPHVHQTKTKTTTITSYRKKSKGNPYRCPACGAYRKKG